MHPRRWERAAPASSWHCCTWFQPDSRVGSDKPTPNVPLPSVGVSIHAPRVRSDTTSTGKFVAALEASQIAGLLEDVHLHSKMFPHRWC